MAVAQQNGFTIYQCFLCDWQGSYAQIKWHCKDHHHESILCKPLVVQINLATLTKKTFIYFDLISPSLLIEFNYDEDNGLAVEVMEVLRTENATSLFNEDHVLVVYADVRCSTKICLPRKLGKFFLYSLRPQTGNNKILNNDIVKHLTKGRPTLNFAFEYIDVRVANGRSIRNGYGW